MFLAGAWALSVEARGIRRTAISKSGAEIDWKVGMGRKIIRLEKTLIWVDNYPGSENRVAH